MPRIRLIHWKAAEAAPRVALLEAAGHEVDYEDRLADPPALLRDLRSAPPAAIVIDLTRLPSHGLQVALSLRQAKGTRHVPLVFADGDREKVERIRKTLPDAVYTSWNRIRSALKQAIAHPPENPIKPQSIMDGYAGVPLPKKLGIKTGAVVALVGAPDDFRKTLGTLPDGVQFRDQPGVPASLTLWFLRSRRDLDRSIGKMVRCEGPVWMIWRKKASGLETDLTQQEVREVGLAAGLVDYKVCAVDATWSGLLFKRR
jgi:hypothetical protein